MKNIIVFIATFVPFIVLGQSTTQNYVKTITYKDSTKTSISIPSQAQASQSITYFDGLGRPMQQIAYRQSGIGNDIVTHIEYDAFGRQNKEYLPNASSQNNMAYIDGNTLKQDIIAQYLTKYGDSTSYSEKLFEASPLNRVLKQAAPGNDWAMGSGHEVKFDYQTNGEDEVRLFTVSLQTDYSPTLITGTYYEENTLYKTITKDENWISVTNNTTEEFKDKEGHVILKRTYNNEVAHDTYYVYDDYGNLTFVIPPIVDVSQTINSNELDNLCYQYKYDYRNRLIEKKLPGKQWEFIAYNSQDMPVATGPVKNPWGYNTWGWLITNYDVFGRVVYTGWAEEDLSGFSQDRATFESQSISNWYVSVGNKTIDGVLTSYNSDPFAGDFKLLTINYYDNYAYPNAPILPATVEEQPVLTNVKSLATGSWVRVLDSPDNTNAELSYTLYDRKGRPIRTHKTNYLGGYTTVDSKLNFAGKLIYTNTYHKREASSSEIEVNDSYEYTLQDRLLSHKQEINGSNKELIAKNDYDDLGQLVTKQVGGQDVSTYVGLQKVDYKYNIRGWLKSINNIDSLQVGSKPKDLFAFKINYNTVENDLSNQVKALYNGNISETFWKTSNDNVLRKYGYQYDNLNRLTNSFYQKPNNTVPLTNMYNEQMNYDKNGNIQSLQRNGDFDSDIYGEIQIDNLNYYYDANKKNQLMKVTDLSNSPKGFKDDIFDSNDVNDDYDYDINGNMIKDDNKYINSIAYNHLNLPTVINFINHNKIEYLYDATGQKKSKKVTIQSVKTTTDYLDGYQYTDESLNFFPHAEGYVNVAYCPQCDAQDPKRFNYVYQYKDHLGNIRVSYGYDQKDQAIKIIEENNYYPFGLKHTRYNSREKQYEPDEEYPELMKLVELPVGEQLAYKYKYNGKEYQDELGLNMYDYGMMFYDPAIGRRNNIDPLAELSRRYSPYSYALDNPVLFIDPDGMKAESSQTAAIYYDWDTGGYRNQQGGTATSEQALAQFGISSDGEPDKKDGKSKTSEGAEVKGNGKGENINYFDKKDKQHEGLYVTSTKQDVEDGVVKVFSHGSIRSIRANQTMQGIYDMLYQDSKVFRNFVDNGGSLTVIFYACLTADFLSDNTKSPIAQQFSDFMKDKRHGLTIVAPTSNISGDENRSKFYVHNNGYWATFREGKLINLDWGK